MEEIVKIPGLQHISEDIFKHLDKPSLSNCRLVNSSWKEILNSPKFWLKKLKSENLYEAKFQSWKILSQDLDHDDQISKEFVLILIKMYQGNPWKPLEIVVKLEDAGKKYPHLAKFILEYEDIKSEVTINVYVGFANAFPGQTPIHLASFYGLTETVAKLLKKYDSPDVKTKPLGGTPLYYAAHNGHLETVKFLNGLTFTPNTPDKFGKTPLWKAACFGHTEVVEFLVAKVENPNSPDEHGVTPLDIAIRHYHSEIVKILISNIENPFAQNANGNTPIHEAVINGCTEIFKFLASKVEDSNAPNLHGIRPIVPAIRLGFIEIVRFLASAGKDLNAPDANGMTPLKLAAQHNQWKIFKILLPIALQNQIEMCHTSNLEVICNNLDL